MPTGDGTNPAAGNADARDAVPRHAHRTMAGNADYAMPRNVAIAVARINAIAMPRHARTTMARDADAVSWHAGA